MLKQFNLIKLLKNKHNVLADTKNVWEKVCACFVDENGNPFEPYNLKDQKKPVKTADEIEKIAKKRNKRKKILN